MRLSPNNYAATATPSSTHPSGHISVPTCTALHQVCGLNRGMWLKLQTKVWQRLDGRVRREECRAVCMPVCKQVRVAAPGVHTRGTHHRYPPGVPIAGVSGGMATFGRTL